MNWIHTETHTTAPRSNEHILKEQVGILVTKKLIIPMVHIHHIEELSGMGVVVDHNARNLSTGEKFEDLQSKFNENK